MQAHLTTYLQTTYLQTLPFLSWLCKTEPDSSCPLRWSYLCKLRARKFTALSGLCNHLLVLKLGDAGQHRQFWPS